MKRFIYLAAVASIALVGCAKNEAVAPRDGTSNQLISFESPVVGVPTKVVTTVGYPKDDKFHVVGKVHTYSYASWSAANDYMDTDVARKEVSTGVYRWVPFDGTNVKHYYWPTGDNDYRLTFIAYSPSTATPTKIDDAGITYTDYNIKSEGLTTDAQIDLLYSYRTYNRNKSISGTGNIGGGYTDYHGDSYDGVNILFEHALSSINFDVKLAEDYADNTIKLKSITLNSIGRKATFTQNLPTGAQINAGVIVEGTAQWTAPSETTNYVPFTKTEGETLSSSKVPAAPQEYYSMFLLPQNLEDSKTVTIKYSITNPESKTVDCSKTVKLNTYTDGNKWVKGYKYIYHIIISLDEIYFAPEVVQWLDGTTTNIAI